MIEFSILSAIGFAIGIVFGIGFGRGKLSQSQHAADQSRSLYLAQLSRLGSDQEELHLWRQYRNLEAFYYAQPKSSEVRFTVFEDRKRIMREMNYIITKIWDIHLKTPQLLYVIANEYPSIHDYWTDINRLNKPNSRHRWVVTTATLAHEVREANRTYRTYSEPDQTGILEEWENIYRQ